MLEKLVNAFFPPVCPICGRVLEKDTYICVKCKKNIRMIKDSGCAKCGKPLIDERKVYCRDCKRKKHSFEKGAVVFEYMGELRESVYRFKYKNAREYADFYAMEADCAYRKNFYEWNIQTIIPVPMYYKKENKRGYNQAQVFARAVSKYSQIHINESCLIRKRPTIPQKELSDEMRAENLSKAFGIDADQVKKYRNVLLVDDIYTTGSTIDACAKLLLAAGVEKVYFLCIAAKKNKTD